LGRLKIKTLIKIGILTKNNDRITKYNGNKHNNKVNKITVRLKNNNEVKK